MAFESFRQDGGPTQHADNKNSVTVDVLETGFIFAFCLLFVCFLVIAPGYKGKLRIYFVLRTTISLFIGASIFLGVVGQDWVSGEIATKTPYKAFTKTEIKAHIGAKIGLGSVNITLTGDPIYQTVADSHHGNYSLKFQERIDYNERFNWAWRQGRFGFGPAAGEIAQELRAAQFKGLPLPILWIAEYFAVDGELIRWGRSFRTAGWYTWQVLWTAVPLWMIANILTVQVLFYSGFMFILTGLTIASSLVIYTTIRWGTQPLIIPFEDEVLTFHFGSSFWLVSAGCITSFLYGCMIVTMDWFCPQKIAAFFNVDVLQDVEEFFPQQPVDGDEESQVNGNGSHWQQHMQSGVQRRLRKHGGGGSSSLQSIRVASSRRSRRLPRELRPNQVVENRGFDDIATTST